MDKKDGSARRAGYADMAKAPRRRTHSMDMPAYSYTEQCPDARYRPGGELCGKRTTRR